MECILCPSWLLQQKCVAAFFRDLKLSEKNKTLKRLYKYSRFVLRVSARGVAPGRGAISGPPSLAKQFKIRKRKKQEKQSHDMTSPTLVFCVGPLHTALVPSLVLACPPSSGRTRTCWRRGRSSRPTRCRSTSFAPLRTPRSWSCPGRRAAGKRRRREIARRSEKDKEASAALRLAAVLLSRVVWLVFGCCC